MGGGGGRNTRIWFENDVTHYEFCSEIDALRYCIRYFPTFLITSDILLPKITESWNTIDKAKLIKIYNELQLYQTAQEEYEEKLTEFYKEVKDSLTTLQEEFEKIIDKYDIFYYTSDKNQAIKKWEIIQKHIDTAIDSEDYNTLIKACNEFKTFSHKIISIYNEKKGYYGGKITQLDFITPKPCPVKPTEPIESKEDSVTFDTTEEIMNDIMGYCNYVNITLSENASKKPFLPQIIYYEDEGRFCNKDLITTKDDLENSEFFKALLKVLKTNSQNILDSYEESAETPDFLDTTAEDINKRAETILARQFNTLYCKIDKDIYNFKIKLEKEQISLGIRRDNDTVVLEDQSDGFKWFFNLFFKLLYGEQLKKGDIVIMDEPAHNLSVPARKKCRDFLKSYGEENGITFVIVTHDPFLIDVDYLEEIRIVEPNFKGENPKGVIITNDFLSIDSNDTDALKTIKQAFGISSHVFFDKNTRVIYVEGITDYMYLTTFKTIINAEIEESQKQSETDNKQAKKFNLAFLPIGGLGQKGEEEKTLQSLMKHAKEPILLVDSDKAGEALQNIAKEKDIGVEIVTLADADSKWKGKEIESLFSEKDKQRYGIADKRSDIATAFKKCLLWRETNKELITKETKENFSKLLQHLNGGI